MAGTTFSQFTPTNTFPDPATPPPSGQESGNVLISSGGGTYWGVVPIASGGTGKKTAQEAIDALTIEDLNLSGTGARIRGDFSNTTVANKVMFQTSTANGATDIGLIPNGTRSTGATATSITLEDSTSISTGNGSTFQLYNVQGTEMRISSSVRGTGSYLPIALYTNNIKLLTLAHASNISTMWVNSGPLTSSASQLVLNTAATGDGWIALVANGGSGGTPFGRLHAGTSTMPMYYEFNSHTFRTSVGGNLLSINASGALGVGTGTDFGVAGDVLLSGGNAAPSYWTSQLPTTTLGVTQVFGTNNTTLATTAFVQAAAAPKAPLASPALTGTPTAPTQVAITGSTQIATTAYVQTAGRNSQGIKTISTTTPSGGSNGDMWYQY